MMEYFVNDITLHSSKHSHKGHLFLRRIYLARVDFVCDRILLSTTRRIYQYSLDSFQSYGSKPYTAEGWLIALRIQHVELLGYTIIVASTISVGLSGYSSWLPWKAKEHKLQGWHDIRLTKQEMIGVLIGVLLILLGAYNETAITL